MATTHRIPKSLLRAAAFAALAVVSGCSLAGPSPSPPLQSIRYVRTHEVQFAPSEYGVSLGYSLPIAGAIVALLGIVIVSYSQLIRAYPAGGGAYTVAHENLGRWPGLVAAASLLIDYTLTVAVSIAACVEAIVSAACLSMRMS